MNGTPPTLSVTITNYNYERFLPQALDSILAQTYTDFELVVVDNASTDGSRALLATYEARDPRVRVVAHEENMGALASLRESCDVSRGRYRVHVDADDWVLQPTAFARQVAMLDAHPRVSFVFSRMTMFGPDGTRTQASRPFTGDVVVPGERALEAVLGFTLTHSGMMVRLDAYHASGGYPDGLPHVDDMLLGVRLCELGDVGYVDDELYAFRQHGGNIHLAPQLAVMREEILPVLEAAFDGPLGPRVPAATQRRLRRQALVHLPTQYVFRGEPAVGWRLWWESARLRPVDTVLQPRTLSLVARTLLGARLFARISARRRS
jgi:glycosyltransferase involved in cell wall biosynthesis